MKGAWLVVKILLDDELKQITDHKRIDEIQRAVNFLMSEGLQSCLYTSNDGFKIAVYVMGEDIKVQRVE